MNLVSCKMLNEELRKALFLQEWLNYNTCDALFVISMSDTRNQGIIALAKYLNKSSRVKTFKY